MLLTSCLTLYPNKHLINENSHPTNLTNHKDHCDVTCLNEVTCFRINAITADSFTYNNDNIMVLYAGAGKDLLKFCF